MPSKKRSSAHPQSKPDTASFLKKPTRAHLPPRPPKPTVGVNLPPRPAEPLKSPPLSDRLTNPQPPHALSPPHQPVNPYEFLHAGDQPRWKPGRGKDFKVKGHIQGVPTSSLPLVKLPPVPEITQPLVRERVLNGWFVEWGLPKHSMELGGDRTLDFNVILGIDRRCPDLPFWIVHKLRAWFGTNDFGAVVCGRLNLTHNLSGPAVEADPNFSTYPGVRCGHFEVFIMGLHESNGPAAVYRFLWGIFEAYGPFALDCIVADFKGRPKARVCTPANMGRWKNALFRPTEPDILPNDLSRLGQWLTTALRMHAQELGKSAFDLLEREVRVNDATMHECAVLSDTIPIAVLTATTMNDAKLGAISAALVNLDLLAPVAVDLLYAYAEEKGIEMEFSVGRRDDVFTACVHWGNGDNSKIIGRAMRAHATHSQSAAALIAARNLDLSVTEFARSGKALLNAEAAAANANNYSVEIGVNGPVLVLD